jgi:DNA-binding PadR family transcriptional regulator
VYRPSPGALHPALRRLVERGLLTVEDIVPVGGRAQRLYQVTEDGRAVHRAWLHQPVDPATVANDLGLHLMRFMMMEDEVENHEVLAYLRDLEAGLDAFVAGMESYLAAHKESARIHGSLALEHGIAVHRASLDWVRSAMAEFAMRDARHGSGDTAKADRRPS